MTKTKLLGGVMMVSVMLLTACASASAAPVPSTPAETVYAKSNAPIATERAFQPTVVTTKEARKPNKPKNPYPCKNFLVRELIDAGFKGENIREAWAIAMRESGGRADVISSTNDYGVFQFNYAAHNDQPWWNSAKLLTRPYNIKIAYEMSRGGKTWYPWDISGKGEWLGRYTPYGIYAKYKSWYNNYPDNCKK